MSNPVHQMPRMNEQKTDLGKLGWYQEWITHAQFTNIEIHLNFGMLLSKLTQIEFGCIQPQ